MDRIANYPWLLQGKRDQAKRKAWDALGRYKFLMFGYWASIWVHLNEVCPDDQPNPFAGLVRLARSQGKEGETDDG